MVVPIEDPAQHVTMDAEGLMDQICYYDLAQSEVMIRLRMCDIMFQLINDKQVPRNIIDLLEDVRRNYVPRYPE